MPEYTYEELIINPTSEKAKNCIGKEVYFSDNIRMCLCRANKYINGFTGILQEIKEKEYHPFKVDDNYYQVIIPKKEEPKPEPEYVPFESISEFIDAYEDSTYNIACDSVEHKLLKRGGIWLKDKATDAYCMVTEICNEGIAVLGKKPIINGMSVYNNSTTWEGLLEDYTFIDGSPCGKLKEA